MIRHIVLLTAACSLFAGCSYFRADGEQADCTGYDLEQTRLDMQPIQVSALYSPTPAINRYFEFYDLNPAQAAHYFGTLRSKDYTLAAHAFVPPDAKGTLVLIHGYFDHTGTLAHLIHEGLKHGYAVVVWDLPGHGLSSGERTDTDGFDLCAEQMKDIISRLAPEAPQPMYIIAHSTGCSIAIEYMVHTKEHEIDGYVFLAPLVRHTHWGWAKFGYGLAKPFRSTIRRRDKKNSSDEKYLSFVKKDPLHSGILSFNYLEELYQWEKRVHTYAPRSEKVLIIQGDQDDIVDWSYNIRFFESFMPQAEVQIIPGARHQLANEIPPYRSATCEFIFDYLDALAVTNPPNGSR